MLKIILSFERRTRAEQYKQINIKFLKAILLLQKHIKANNGLRMTQEPLNNSVDSTRLNWVDRLGRNLTRAIAIGKLVESTILSLNIHLMIQYKIRALVLIPNRSIHGILELIMLPNKSLKP